MEDVESVTYRIEQVASADDVSGLLERELRAFNEQTIGPYGFTPIALLLRGPGKEIGGGFFGYAGLGWLNISKLWVDEPLRGRGYGRALMEAGEALGREQGCAHAFLFTFSFQAPAFYRALGYTEFAVLENFPPGAERLFFRKDL